MKIAVCALLGLVSAFKLNESPDHPDSNKVFSYNERVAAAAGLTEENDIQLSACMKAGHKGVSCVPNAQFFATGMNGDEDLGQDITMKGQKFHYAEPAHNATHPHANALFATGMNGDEDLGQDITMKGQKFHYAEPAAHNATAPHAHSFFATGMNGDEDLG